MLKSINMQEFTVFQDTKIDFVSGLNIFIGENSVGKTHILKLGYALSWISHEVYKRENDKGSSLSQIDNKDLISKKIVEKMVDLFRPEEFGRLVHRYVGRKKANISAEFTDPAGMVSFSFSNLSKKNVTLEKFSSSLKAPAVYIPPHDVVSMMPFIKDVWEQYPGILDVSYYDLGIYLSKTVPAGPQPKEVRAIFRDVEEILGGRVILDNGRFYLRIPKGGSIEIPLIAEGLRKIAMLAHLVANRSIQESSIIFWDEPESNLNPRLIKALAKILLRIASNSTQVVIATHSLFLLRELDILSQNGKYRLPMRCFALYSDESGEVSVNVSDNIGEVAPLVSLDEELQQTDRFFNLVSAVGKADE